jgi:hypothetical protein
MEELTSCPEEMANDVILQELYETARINKLTNEEMKLYEQSVLDYDDVRDAVNFARLKARRKALLEGEERGIEIGEKRGEKRGIEIGEQRGEKRGIEIGEQRGRIEERNRLVKTLYSRKMSLKEIAEHTNLTEKEVFEIIDKS